MTRMSRIWVAAIGLVLLALQPIVPLLAQTALGSPTLSAALAAPAQGSPNNIITVSSGTGFAVGVGVYVDAEYMVVTATQPQTTRWTVQRGQRGTVAAGHASGAVAWVGAANNFYDTDVSGPCVSTAEQALPHINVGKGNLFSCAAINTLAGSAAATWARNIVGGLPLYDTARYTGWTYVTLGALTIQPGTQLIGSAGALAMTLAAPAKYQDGMVMVLMASTAQAHTVTYTAGFFGTTTSSDVATFGGAIGDQLTIVALNGVWRPISSRNVTIA